MNMARPSRPSYPLVAIIDNETISSSDDPSTSCAALAKKQEACSSLRFHMDNSVWDIIHKEGINWRDPSLKSMSLPGNKTCENVVQSCAVAATKVRLILVTSLHPMSPQLGRPGINRVS